MSKNTIHEKQKLYKEIWSIADELRGSVDGWDFKNYVLGMIFYKYISEKFAFYIDDNEHKAGYKNFSYANLTDEYVKKFPVDLIEDCQKTYNFFIYPSQLFCNVYKNLDNHKEDLNIILQDVFNGIENSVYDGQKGNFRGLFKEIDLSSNKLGASVFQRNDKLIRIIKGIAKMDFSDSNDVAGDAYEFLMSMYASNAGKSGGEFFTPQEVSELLMRLAVTAVGENKRIKTIYDPACGSGSLLLKAKKVLKGKESEMIKYFGQEINLTTYNMARMNMFIHNVSCSNFDIKNNNTLTNPEFLGGHFDIIVSNPPYSIKWDGDNDPKLKIDERFIVAGTLAPKSKADMAFIMHSIYYLSSDGAASIVCFPGILYRSGAEQKIREYMLKNNFVDCVIQLPENLFFGTSISTCIIVLKKNKKDENVLFIDASKEFVKSTNNNLLSEENINRIVNTLKERKDIDSFCKLVSQKEIQDNDCILSVNNYVIKKSEEDKIDINVLNKEIERIVADQNKIRNEINKIIERIK